MPVIAEKLGKPQKAVRAKINRLGLEVDDQSHRICSTTSKLPLPKSLPSVEKARAHQVVEVKDNVEFLAGFWGLNLLAYQKEFSDVFAQNQFLAARGCRQSGKSWTVSASC